MTGAIDLSRHHRILVLGIPASGKSTLSTVLSASLGLPAIHLDDIYFGKAWQPTARADWEKRLADLCSGADWIIDGNYHTTLHLRLIRADLAIIVDVPPALCLFRYIRRLVRLWRMPLDILPVYMRGADGRRILASRPMQFAVFILLFRLKVLPGMLREVKRSKVQVLHLKGSSQVSRFLNSFDAQPGSN